MMNESWKSVVGYEGVYDVSNLGNVRSLNRHTSAGHLLKGKTLKQCLNKKTGYYYVDLNYNGRKNSIVHRLVAIAFLGVRDSSIDVNHMDGIKTNNNIENLEWVSRTENMIHAVQTGLYPKGENHHLYGKKIGSDPRKYVRMSGFDGTVVVFRSIATAAKAMGVLESSISRNCRGLSKSCSGYSWAYVV